MHHLDKALVALDKQESVLYQLIDTIRQTKLMSDECLNDHIYEIVVQTDDVAEKFAKTQEELLLLRKYQKNVLIRLRLAS